MSDISALWNLFSFSSSRPAFFFIFFLSSSRNSSLVLRLARSLSRKFISFCLLSQRDIHYDEHRELFALPLFLLVLFFEFLKLFGFVVDYVVHDSVEGFLAAVGLDLFDGGVEDGAFEFFGESISEGVVGAGDVVDGADVGDVARWIEVYREKLLRESYAFLRSIFSLHYSRSWDCARMRCCSSTSESVIFW